MERLKSAVFWVLLLAVAVGLSAGATWPAITQTATHVAAPIDHPDTTVGFWWPWAVAEAISELRNPLMVPHLGWPEGQDVSLVLWSFTVEALFFPLPLIYHPIQAMNVQTFCILVLNGLACAWAGRVTSRSWWGALAGLAFGATSAYTFFECSWGRPQQGLWAPLPVFLGALVLLDREPGQRKARIIGAVALAAAAAVYWFYGYFLGILTLLLAGSLVVRRVMTRERFLDFAIVGGGGILLVLPLMLPVFAAALTAPESYEGVKDSVNMPTVRVQVYNALFAPHAIKGMLAGPQHDFNTPYSLVTLPILILGLWLGKGPGRWLAGLGVMSLLFSMGPYLMSGPDIPYLFAGSRWIPLPMAILDWLPGWDRFWWPYRWQAATLACASMVAAWGVSRLPVPYVFAVALGGFLAVDNNFVLRGGVGQPQPVSGQPYISPAFLALADLGGERPILQVPLGSHPNSLVGWQAYHRQPIDGGIAWQMKGVRNPEYEERRQTVPLWVDMDLIWSGEEPLRAARTPWTEEETAGYHYVMMFPSNNPHDVAAIEALDAYLGEAFHSDNQVRIWALEGVAVTPEIP